MANHSSFNQDIMTLREERDLLAKLLEESKRKLEMKTREYALLTRIGDIVKHSFDVNAICQNFASIILEETNAENCSLLLKQHTSGNLLLKVACGTRHEKPTFFEDLNQSSIIFKVGEGVAGKVALEGESILINDVKNDRRFDQSRKNNVHISSLLCCPLIWQNRLLGVINMSSSKVNAFNNDDLHTISIFSAFVSSILCNATTYNELALTQKQFRAEAEERRRIEETLRETKEHLNNVIESSIDCIMVSDKKGHITKVNKYFLDLMGYEEEEVMGKHVLECTPMIAEGTYECSTGEVLKIGKEFANEATARIAELIHHGKATNWEAYYLRKDKRLVPIEQNIVCLYDKDGERTGAVAVIRDITTRKKAERALKESKEFLEKVIENTKDAILIVDEKGYILSANSSMGTMSGFSREEMTGKHASELIVRDEETRKIILEKTAELLEKGFATYEAQYRSKDGKCIDVECTSSMIGTDRGEYIGGVSIIRDITERKRAEREIRKGKEFLENLFKASVDGIIITDAQGVISMVNAAAARMLGFDADELIGKSTSVLNPEGKQYEDLANKYLEELFEQGSVTAFEFTWGKKDGTLLDVEINAVLSRDTDNTITGAMTSIRDITERKHQQKLLQEAYDEMETRVQERTIDLEHANAQLKQEIIERERAEKKLFESKEIAEYANKAKSEFLANMSHEFRTPLNHIIGFTELVVDKNFGDLNGTQEEYLNDVLHSSKHLLSLINDILDLSKVEAGKMHLEPSPVDLKLLLDQSLIMFKEKTFKHGIKLVLDVENIPEMITADERKLKQILYNLLSNAVKFTPDDGKIFVQGRMADCFVREGKRWGDSEGMHIITGHECSDNAEEVGCRKCIEISVSDTGIGINGQDLERIFKPFEQADGSAGRRYQGTGLGLSLTKRLVELHGGKIWVESEGEGKGATFRFTIPG